MTAQFTIAALATTHDRRAFTCGVEPLDRYFREQVTQDIRRRITNCFVALDRDGAVAAFYTFAATSLPLTELPPETARRLPRYPILPAALVGRLAVARDRVGHGLGGALLADALLRARRAEPAIFALIVEAKDEGAGRFYAHHGFRAFISRKLAMFLAVGGA